MNDDLFSHASRPPVTPRSAAYSAKDIEVLEGLEPVRRHPGMYIGGTDEAALHHLAAEILDNAMDEVVAGHASRIEFSLEAGNTLAVRDNGRGIPVDAHPKFRHLSALEVILTTLHAGGKFGSGAYTTSGGLHGVGASVVNALSDHLHVEVVREQHLWKQEYARGKPLGPVVDAGPAKRGRGTLVRFHPDPQIFGPLAFQPDRLWRLCRSKAYLVRGVEIHWRCAPSLLAPESRVPEAAVFCFPGGLRDSLQEEVAETQALTQVWAGAAPLPASGDAPSRGRVEWALVWLAEAEGFVHSYCNTVPTEQGGTHEAGLRTALLKGLRAWGEQRGNRRAAAITAEDAAGGLAAKLSLFLRNPQFSGQTKEKLTTPEAQRLVEAVLRDHFDHFLAGDPAAADALLGAIVERAEERLRRREQKTVARKTATRRLRLPGKLADCSLEDAARTELFLVEGDSAGGSAKQARDRATQAVLPLRGKILNVASASADKLRQNQELRDLIEALGCGAGERCDVTQLRYGRIVIMTDADVDGAHIASLLMTFFWRELPEVVRHGHLYLAQPPLYRLQIGAKSFYAMDDADRDRVLARMKPGAKAEISRFKGLGEMPPAVLRETTMDPAKRTLLRVLALPEDGDRTRDVVEQLMGRRPELRFAFLQEHAHSITDVDV